MTLQLLMYTSQHVYDVTDKQITDWSPNYHKIARTFLQMRWVPQINE